jgi:uncharacterized protein YndB with AHSA1/START domain
MNIIVKTTVKAPIQKVWDAYTQPEHIKQWNAASDDWHTTASQVDLRVGGQFSSRMEAKDGSFGFDFAGTYTTIIPLELIEYVFGERTATVEFKQTSEGVTVQVSFVAETEHSIEQQQEGWQAILNRFAKHVASMVAHH